MRMGQVRFWQIDPARITTDRVQLWNDSGTMITAQLSKKDAQQMILDRKCFVMTEQAIGLYEGSAK